MAALLPGNPRFVPVRRSSTTGKRRSISTSDPSVEALSTTTTDSRLAGQRLRSTASTASSTVRPPFQFSITTRTDGGVTPGSP